MEITNPQVFDHIIGINGEILQPKVLLVSEIENTKIQSDPIIWRKTTADEYHVPTVLLSSGGGLLQIQNIPYGDVNPAKRCINVGLINRPDFDEFLLPPGILEANGSLMRVKVIEIGV